MNKYFYTETVRFLFHLSSNCDSIGKSTQRVRVNPKSVRLP